MKTRQFQQLAGVPRADRADLVLEGLRAIAENVGALASELKKCNEARALRAAELVYNAGREEAGKFLILIDVWRSPGAGQRVISRQFWRAGDHLSKLIYAQMADYSIASQAELLNAINRHRQGLYLDGPTDYDWIFRNDLLTERERALYVDLVDSEGSLEWWPPSDNEIELSIPFSMRLVTELMSTGLVAADGLRVLKDAWTGFDPHHDSHCQDWHERTLAALMAFPHKNFQDGKLTSSGSFVVTRWPMPMVELVIEMEKLTIQELQAQRETLHDAWLEEEFGEETW